jgi:methyltransferase-like protein/2-polyprenyl-3-methyl-5-hydroxy-6-metoxy-1,4-benzoquinol methylase
MTDENTYFYSYDDIPYPDMSHSFTHPQRMATIATLVGMKPAPVDRCRVLELGCAGGWNLIPMADTFPESAFVGIDNSARHIKGALESAEKLNLKNTRFHQMDILDVEPDFGEFDYIIAHGVYSWVPPRVRDKVMAICKQNLAPQGVAYISYNTYPGWHTLVMLRHMMLFHIRDIQNPRQRAEEAIKLIKFLSEGVSEKDNAAYKSIFEWYLQFHRWELDDVQNLTFLLHDHLENVNTPFYFHEFAEHAAQHGLQYVAEANFANLLPHEFSKETLDQLRQFAHTTIEIEQYLDYLRNRFFRRTLLCHDDVLIDRQIKPERAFNFYFVSSASRVESDRPGIASFKGPDGAQFATDHPLTIAALEHLCEMSPQPVSFRELLAKAGYRLGLTSPAAQDAVIAAASLLQAYTYSLDLIELHIHPLPFLSHLTERPVARPLSRYQAKNGAEITNMRHERVKPGALGRALIQYMDGTRTRDDLMGIVRGLMAEGALRVDTDEVMGELNMDTLLEKELDDALDLIARTALLVG